jgi:hypothetical protein
MFNQMKGRFTRAALIAVIALFSAGIISAEERAPRNASTEVRRLLPWFPEDTESLLAAQSFAVPRPSSVDAFESKWAILMPSLAMGEFDQYLEPVVDRKILIALKGIRRSQPVGSLGDFYAEGCVVVVFERDLGDAGVEWTSALRKGAEEIRKIAGREVFCLSPGSSRARARRHPLVYFLRLAPDTILCASHDEYLRQLLNRIDTAPRGRAFPDSLPQWGTIDRSAPVWMIRKVPASQQKLVEGVTWTWANDQARVVYLPRGSSAERVLDRARRFWEGSKAAEDIPGLAPLSESLRKVIHCELGKQGRVTVSFKTEGQEQQTVRFPLYLLLFHAQIEDGDVGPT